MKSIDLKIIRVWSRRADDQRAVCANVKMAGILQMPEVTLPCLQGMCESSGSAPPVLLWKKIHLPDKQILWATPAAPT